MSVKPVNSAEYVPIRHVITFIAYRMNWSIMRSVEWLLARDYEQYISSYKLGEDSKYYKINDNDTTDNVDIATRYLLKRTLVIGHGAICTEGKKEESKDFYKAYYKMEDLDGHYILDRLDLDFNEIYHFNFNTDAKGFVKATNHKLFDIIDGFIISTPSVTPIKSDPYEQYLIELEQLRIDNTKNDAKIEQQHNEQLIDEYKEFVKTAQEVIDQLQDTIKQKEQDIMLLNKQAYKPADEIELNPKTQTAVTCLLNVLFHKAEMDITAHKGTTNQNIVNLSKSLNAKITEKPVSHWIKQVQQLRIDTQKKDS